MRKWSGYLFLIGGRGFVICFCGRPQLLSDALSIPLSLVVFSAPLFTHRAEGLEQLSTFPKF